MIIQLRPGLGDLCMFLPRCHEIAINNPKFEIYLLTKKNTKAKQLLKYDPYINQIEYIDDEKNNKKLFKIFKFFLINKFKKVYSYQYGPKYLKYILISKITSVNEIKYYGIFKKKENMIEKSILANQDWLNITISKRHAKIYLNERNVKNNNKIILGIGASGDNKRWPTEYFIDLINMLNDFKNFDYILAGGPGEKNIINRITRTKIHGKFISLENLNVSESIKEIDGSLLFIGNDTGFMHVAACLDIQTFCLYGDTPSRDSEYNKNIIPILPPEMKETYHKDLAMNKILPNRVYSIIIEKIS